jgi:hypothetical protein
MVLTVVATVTASLQTSVQLSNCSMGDGHPSVIKHSSHLQVLNQKRPRKVVYADVRIRLVFVAYDDSE